MDKATENDVHAVNGSVALDPALAGLHYSCAALTCCVGAHVTHAKRYIDLKCCVPSV